MNFKLVPILFLLLPFFLYGCYATKKISPSDKAINKKKIALVYKDQNIYEISDLIFNNNELQGKFNRLIIPPIPKLMKIKMLDVYLKPDNIIQIDTTQTGPVNIPYESILKIEKTRIRVEYFLIVPVLIPIIMNLNVTGSSF